MKAIIYESELKESFPQHEQEIEQIGRDLPCGCGWCIWMRLQAAHPEIELPEEW